MNPTKAVLASLLTQAHLACRGETVRLYKRAQIFVGDVWGAFQVLLPPPPKPVIVWPDCLAPKLG